LLNIIDDEWRGGTSREKKNKQRQDLRLCTIIAGHCGDKKKSLYSIKTKERNRNNLCIYRSGHHKGHTHFTLCRLLIGLLTIVGHETQKSNQIIQTNKTWKIEKEKEKSGGASTERVH